MNAGKGDKPRPVNKAKYNENYKKIFGDKDYGRLGERFADELEENCEDCFKKIGIKKFKKTY
jgi:hypothetical protein